MVEDSKIVHRFSICNSIQNKDYRRVQPDLFETIVLSGNQKSALLDLSLCVRCLEIQEEDSWEYKVAALVLLNKLMEKHVDHLQNNIHKLDIELHDLKYDVSRIGSTGSAGSSI